MAKTMTRSVDLPLEDVSRQDFYDLAETMAPTAAIADGSNAATDQTLEVSTGLLRAAMKVPRWRKLTVAFDNAALDVAATAANVALMTTGTLGVILAALAKHSTAFAGTAISGLTVTVGTAGAPTLLLGATAPLEMEATANPVSATAFRLARPALADVDGTGAAAAGTALIARFTATGGNLNALTAGSVDIYLLYAEIA
jgi:hypothetical protein